MSTNSRVSPRWRDPPLGEIRPETESEVLAFLQGLVPLGNVTILEVQSIHFQATWRGPRSGPITLRENLFCSPYT
jgi:hypothetical protein